MTSTVKRFIAGAVCPRCAEMDKITMYEDDQGVQYRECVACGFEDKMGGEPKAEELPTRVNQTPPQAVEVEPVVFFRATPEQD